MKKITLKKVKIVEALSEETLCFTADVYEDGKLIAHVANRGYGGPTDITPAKGVTHKDVAHLDNLDTECEIMTLAENANMVKKFQSNAFVLEKDEKIFTSKNPQGLSFAKMKKAMNIRSFLPR